MRMRVAASGLAVAVLIAAAGPTMALPAFPQTRTVNTALEFATQAAQDNLFEIALGTLAQERAANQQVRTFGQRMVTDRTTANQQLMQLAAQKGWTLPTTMSARQQRLYDRLSRLTGLRFDLTYMRLMVRDQEADVARFQAYAQSGTDAELRAWVSQTLPVLQQDLQLAIQTAAALGLRV